MCYFLCYCCVMLCCVGIVVVQWEMHPIWKCSDSTNGTVQVLLQYIAPENSHGNDAFSLLLSKWELNSMIYSFKSAFKAYSILCIKRCDCTYVSHSKNSTWIIKALIAFISIESHLIIHKWEKWTNARMLERTSERKTWMKQLWHFIFLCKHGRRISAPLNHRTESKYIRDGI